jgi:hypothetical protein
MTALTGPTKVPSYSNDVLVQDIIPLDVAASAIIYPGSMVGVDIAGNAKCLSAAAGLRPLGRCIEDATVDNSAGAAGALTVQVARGVFFLANSTTTDALTKADIGRKCYVVDDNTVARTSNFGKRSVMGTFYGLLTVQGATRCIVEVGSIDEEPTEVRFLAGADLSAKQYFFVKLDSNSAVVLAGAGEAALGILQNAPASGAVAIVKFFGPSHCIGGGAITKGGSVAADSNGKGKAAVLSTVNTSDAGAAADPVVGSNVMGFALETGVADTDFMVFLQPRGAIPTTAA